MKVILPILVLLGITNTSAVTLVHRFRPPRYESEEKPHQMSQIEDETDETMKSLNESESQLRLKMSTPKREEAGVIDASDPIQGQV